MEIVVPDALMGAVVGALVGGGIAYLISNNQIRTAQRNAIDLIHINSKKLAGMRLRDAFAPELARLQYPEGYRITEFSHMLEAAFGKHQMAINEFRFFLKNDELASFNEAWKEYYRCPYKPKEDKPDFTKFVILPEKSKESIKEIINQIEVILEFTKYIYKHKTYTQPLIGADWQSQPLNSYVRHERNEIF
ncbi:hypothetical protein HY605_05845 [Candidatus Peregrinibacteria bacterium]|nr:hypothetical protein [Candidatus Peregrinibacteria bacterium]